MHVDVTATADYSASGGNIGSGVGLELMERVRVPVPRLGRPAAPHIVEGDDLVPRSRKVRDLSKAQPCELQACEW